MRKRSFSPSTVFVMIYSEYIKTNTSGGISKMNTKWLKKTLIAMTCCLAVFSAQAAVGTSYVGQAQAASATTASAKADKIISAAKALQGKVTYKFGVNNPSKLYFDCSSFTK